MTDAVLFSIDNAHDFRTIRRFMDYVDKLKAMEKLSGNVIQCIGSYEGKMELSWLMKREDFDEWILNTEWVENQNSFLMVYTNGKHQIACLRYNPTSRGDVYLGRLVEVTPEEAFKSEVWVYRPDLNKYWNVE